MITRGVPSSRPGRPCPPTIPIRSTRARSSSTDSFSWLRTSRAGMFPSWSAPTSTLPTSWRSWFAWRPWPSRFRTRSTSRRGASRCSSMTWSGPSPLSGERAPIWWRGKPASSRSWRRSSRSSETRSFPAHPGPLRRLEPAGLPESRKPHRDIPAWPGHAGWPGRSPALPRRREFASGAWSAFASGNERTLPGWSSGPQSPSTSMRLPRMGASDDGEPRSRPTARPAMSWGADKLGKLVHVPGLFSVAPALRRADDQGRPRDAGSCPPGPIHSGIRDVPGAPGSAGSGRGP